MSEEFVKPRSGAAAAIAVIDIKRSTTTLDLRNREHQSTVESAVI